MPLGIALGGLVAPPLCWGCERPARRGEPLCAGCRASLHRLPVEPVRLCGVPVWAPLAYSGAARALVHALKFHRARGVADAMAAQIAANAPAGWLAPAGQLGDDRIEAPPSGQVAVRRSVFRTVRLPPGERAGSRGLGVAPVLVPVPLHPRRLRSRGFNQAELIAAALAARTGLEVADCLLRGGPALTQVGRDRAERRAGPAGEIRLRPPARRGFARAAAADGFARGAPERVVLVDDVVTTGATLGACSAALRAGGALEVAAVSFARTLGR